LDQPLVMDMYDPFVLENLPGRAHRSTAARLRHHAADVAALAAQLDAGDLFLCASEEQRDLWLGALAARGRVNPTTYAQDPSLRALIDVVPFGLPAKPPEESEGPVLKGAVDGIGPRDRVVLWGGGIWNWFDPLTLIRAVGRLADAEGRLRLFFLGTRSPNPNVPPAPMVASARDLARELGLLGTVVHFNEGWVPYAARGAYLSEADIGASCHLPYVEARFAYRTRLLDYIWAGLPMLVTAGDALADLVDRRGLGETVPPQDVAATAAALGRLLATLDDRAARTEMAARFEAVRPGLTWDRAVTPLVRFLSAPRRAADGPPGRRTKGAGISAAPGAAPTPWRNLPGRAREVLGEGGPLMLLEEAARYLRWLRRPR
ncbi:MAG: glycosyltransferase, partial [Anaerolineae bacterium]